MVKLIAGIDIGNATTEVALAEVGPAPEQVRFLSSAIVPTTGIKGTSANIRGLFQSLTNALGAAGRRIEDLDSIRINEAAPVIGDVAMETITETIITESTMIGHNPSTPGGLGIGVGTTIDIDSLPAAPAGQSHAMQKRDGTGSLFSAEGLKRGSYTIECTGVSDTATFIGVPFSGGVLESSARNSLIWSTVVGVTGVGVLILGIVLVVRTNKRRRDIQVDIMMSGVQRQ